MKRIAVWSVLSVAAIGGAIKVFADKERVLDFNDIPRPVVRQEAVDPAWFAATSERRFRIAPLEIELCDEPPHVQDVFLPAHEAFQGEVKALAVVPLADRYCWGVLLVSQKKSWNKIKIGNYIPVLSVSAKVNK